MGFADNWIMPKCTSGKRGYLSRADAKASVRRKRKELGRMNAYSCECGYWHLGHRSTAYLTGKYA